MNDQATSDEIPMRGPSAPILAMGVGFADPENLPGHAILKIHTQRDPLYIMLGREEMETLSSLMAKFDKQDVQQNLQIFLRDEKIYKKLTFERLERMQRYMEYGLGGLFAVGLLTLWQLS